MKTYRPFILYSRTVMIIVVFILAITFLGTQSDKLPGIVIPSLFGLVYLIGQIINNQRIVISGDVLTYYQLRKAQSVNLTELTNCNYHLYYGYVSARTWPNFHYVFHLYDSSGGYVTMPANYWLHRKDLFSMLANAVKAKAVGVDAATAAKLHVQAATPISANQTPQDSPN